MLRTLAIALLGAAAVFAIGRAIVPDAEGDRPRSPERRAAQVLSRTLAKKLPLERSAKCRRSGRARRGVTRFSCRWRAARRLTPNRTRRCRGRAVVAISRKHRRVRTRRRRCALEVKALDPRFGFHDNSVDGHRATPDQVARLAEGTGAGIYRFTVDWRSIEPQPNVYDFSMPDRVYKAMVARGVRPLFLITWAPSWAWDPLVLCSNPSCHYPPRPGLEGHWGQFAALIAKRYPKAAGIEIWNEPNERSSWNSGADPVRYVRLLRAAYEAVKKVDPNMPVIGGGLANRADTDRGGLSVADFASAVFAAGGASYMDGIGIHPYAPIEGLDRFSQPLDILRSLRPKELPIWVTEVGLTTTAGQVSGTEEQQAQADVAAYRTFHDQPDVKAILIYTLIDPYDPATHSEDGFGIVRGDLSEKPAYCALAKETGARSRCP